MREDLLNMDMCAVVVSETLTLVELNILTAWWGASSSNLSFFFASFTDDQTKIIQQNITGIHHAIKKLHFMQNIRYLQYSSDILFCELFPDETECNTGGAATSPIHAPSTSLTSWNSGTCSSQMLVILLRSGDRFRLMFAKKSPENTKNTYIPYTGLKFHYL